MQRRRYGLALLLLCGCVATGCDGREPEGAILTFSGSAVGAEAEVLRSQLERFQELRPGIRVEIFPTPDAADQRHQLYVQWLNAKEPDPDILQLDVIWTPEFAAAGWILPLDPFEPEEAAFLPAALEANRWDGELFALPWFVDVGMLYWRTDLLEAPPGTFKELTAQAAAAQERHGLPYGFVWQGARYEGLITVFLEHVAGFGGQILDKRGRVAVDAPQVQTALRYMRQSVESGVVPRAALTWQEEQARFAFQNGQAVFMRNWPYAYSLMQDDEESRVAGRFAVAPMPAAAGGSPAAALGGQQLAVNANTEDPEAAWAVIDFLTRPQQMLERAQVVGQFPTLTGLYDDPALGAALPVAPDDVEQIVRAARPRPVTPVYTQLSQILQIRLHEALSGQLRVEAALDVAAREMRALLDSVALGGEGRGRRRQVSPAAWVVALLAAAGLAIWWWRRRSTEPVAATEPARGPERAEARLAWALVVPVLFALALVAVFPLGWTLWESFHGRDLRMPWLGRPFVGFENYVDLAGSGRFWLALGHTALFTLAGVSLELILGLILALALNRTFRGRGPVRAVILLPWAIPTVVAALIWRFMFDAQAGITNAVLVKAGFLDQPFAWFVHSLAAWVPVVLADVWKTTPFVALILLAGLQNIDQSLYEAARIDGAGVWQQFLHVTLPLLKPAILVALLFRSLDALRVFDLIYVLTGGGPGTATEPIALYTFNVLLSHLRFGFGSALSVVIFVTTLLLALFFIRVLGADLTGELE